MPFSGRATIIIRCLSSPRAIFYPTKSHSDTLALSSNDNVKVEKGDYITRIAPGAYSICKEAAFNKIYEPVK